MTAGGWHRSARRGLAALSSAAFAAGVASSPVSALTIELRDVAPDRIERQRAEVEGRLPLPGTPDVARLKERLAEKGLKSGSAVYIRAFKAESELELWIAQGDRFVHFATYPVCNWSGTLGPKITEGDKQTPEGFYVIGRRQLHRSARWQQALNLGFPNTYDRRHSRKGSYILVHGGCSSVGCFAMTNVVVEEIFGLVGAAIAAGQPAVPMHVFPFRMSDANLERYRSDAWQSFWENLKTGYDSFERTSRPPLVSVCEQRYLVQDNVVGTAGADAGGSLLRRALQRFRDVELPTTCELAQGPEAAVAARVASSGEAAERPRRRARANESETPPADTGGVDTNGAFSDIR